MNEEQVLKLVLELSEQTERERLKALFAQEKDIAQAVERSLIDSPPRPGPSGPRPGPSTLVNENASSSPTILRDPLPLPHTVTLLPVDIQLKEDEELARRLEAEYDSGPSTPSSETKQRVDPIPSESAPLPPYTNIVSKEGTR